MKKRFRALRLKYFFNSLYYSLLLVLGSWLGLLGSWVLDTFSICCSVLFACDFETWRNNISVFYKKIF